MSDSKSLDKPFDCQERRNFLGTATAVVGSVGVAAAAWPFVSSMNPSADVLDNSITEVDIKAIEVGQSKTVSWQGKPVFVMHRTAGEVSAMQGSKGGKDPQEDTARAPQPEWLVVVGLCTHLGCVPTRNEEGWLCPCHGSVYDNSGRILSGPAPTNLEVPPYRFDGPEKIIIG